MTTKTFRAPNMLEALNDIQRELGPDALVLSVREVQDGPAWKVWQRAEIEVLASAANSAMPPAKPAPDLTELPTEEDAVSHAGLWAPYSPSPTRPAGYGPQNGKTHNALHAAQQKLSFQGLDEALLEKIITTSQDVLNPTALNDPQRVEKHLSGQIAAGLRTMRESKIAANNILFLVGSSGAGKTSTTAKLAAYFSTTLKRKVVWICADTIRAGAIAEARAYTDSLGIPLHLAYTPGELARVASERSGDALVLVDMPNTNPHSEDDMILVGEYLAALPFRDTYLVLPATAKDVDLRQLLAAFGAFHINGLIVTKMDESETIGSVVNSAWRSKLPLVFFTNGPQVTDDLHPAQPHIFVEQLFR